jgi:hypothetical protein
LGFRAYKKITSRLTLLEDARRKNILRDLSSYKYGMKELIWTEIGDTAPMSWECCNKNKNLEKCPITT